MAGDEKRKVEHEFREYAPASLFSEDLFYQEEQGEAKRRIGRYLTWALAALLALIVIFYLLILYLPS